MTYCDLHPEEPLPCYACREREAIQAESNEYLESQR